MTPNEYYRDKHTGEWCFCVSVNGTHSKVVPVYSEKLTSSDEDEETEKKSESKKDSDSDFDPDDENAKKGKRKKKKQEEKRC